MLEWSYEKVRLRDLLDHMELSKGGFYHHFRSVQEVLQALVQQDLTQSLKALRGDAQDGSAVKGLAKIFSLGSQHFGSETGILAAISSDAGKHLYLQLLESEFYQPLREILLENLALGMEQQEYLAGDIDSIGESFIALCSHANRAEILGLWSQEKSESYLGFSLELLSATLGLGEQLLKLIKEDADAL